MLALNLMPIILFVCVGWMMSHQNGSAVIAYSQEVKEQKRQEYLDKIKITILGYTIEPNPLKKDPIWDYEHLVIVHYKITNGSNEPFYYSHIGWRVTFDEAITYTQRFDFDEMYSERLAPNTTQEAKFQFQLDGEAEFEQFEAKYTLINYDKEFWRDYRLLLRESKTVASQFKDKYNDAPILEFMVQEK